MNRVKTLQAKAVTVVATVGNTAIPEQSVPKSQRIGLTFKIFKYLLTVVPIVGIDREGIQSTGVSGIRIVKTLTLNSLTLKPRRRPAFSVPLLSVASVALRTTIVATVI
jgi:hypothetical protein